MAAHGPLAPVDRPWRNDRSRAWKRSLASECKCKLRRTCMLSRAFTHGPRYKTSSRLSATTATAVRSAHRNAVEKRPSPPIYWR